MGEGSSRARSQWATFHSHHILRPHDIAAQAMLEQNPQLIIPFIKEERARKRQASLASVVASTHGVPPAASKHSNTKSSSSEPPNPNSKATGPSQQPALAPAGTSPDNVQDDEQLAPQLKGLDPQLIQAVENEIIEVVNNADCTTFGSIGGLVAVKRCLTEIIVWPLRNPGLFNTEGLRKLPKGVLLFGLRCVLTWSGAVQLRFFACRARRRPPRRTIPQTLPLAIIGSCNRT